MSDLRRLAYLSTSRKPMSSAELAVLCAVSEHNNRIESITGILLYVDGSFLQVVEGPCHAIRMLLAKLEVDERHTSMTVLENVSASERLFPDWAMEGRGAAYRDLDGVYAPSESFTDMVRRLWAREEAAFIKVFLRNFFMTSLPRC